MNDLSINPKFPEARIQAIISCHQCLNHKIAFDPHTKIAYHICDLEDRIVHRAELKDASSIPDIPFISFPDWCKLPRGEQ